VQELRRQTGYGPHRLALRAGSTGPFPLASHHPPHPATSWPPASASDPLPLLPWRLGLGNSGTFFPYGCQGHSGQACPGNRRLGSSSKASYASVSMDRLPRMRFLASSHTRTRSIGVAFLLVVTFWIRAHGIERPLVFQTDWGQEFGGDNPATMQALEHRFLSFKPNWPALPKGASNTMGEWNAATAPIGGNSIGRSSRRFRMRRPCSRWRRARSSTTT
jgi:hypothetical protein